MDWNFPVRAAKIEELRQRLEKLGVGSADLQEKFVRGSGKGGQKVNKTNNCVQLTHLPTGTVVHCHAERDRSLNRFMALRQLCDNLEGKASGGVSEAEQKKIDKIRKQKSRRKRRSKSKSEESEGGEREGGEAPQA
jgi:protein subunit release factor B